MKQKQKILLIFMLLLWCNTIISFANPPNRKSA